MRSILVLIKLVLTSLIDPLVAITIMTTLALLFGILAFAKTPEGGVSQIMITLCWGIGVFGLLAVITQIYSIVKRKRLQQRIANFYVMGHNIIVKLYQAHDAAILAEEAEEWRRQVEPFLRNKLGQSYLSKFNSQPPTIIGVPDVFAEAPGNLYRGISNRLFWLDRFSGEKD
jgi:hypothetical protein